MFNEVKSHVIIKDETSFLTGLDSCSIEAPHLDEIEDSLLSDIVFTEVRQRIYTVPDYSISMWGPSTSLSQDPITNSFIEPEVERARA